MLFKVELQYARNVFDNILRIPELEQLFKRNGRTLGMDFTTNGDVLTHKSGACACVLSFHQRGES